MVDVSPRMVELARARGVDARVGDVQELPFDDGSFDCAVAAWMLFHVPDLDRGLAELARVLRPGRPARRRDERRASTSRELRELAGTRGLGACRSRARTAPSCSRAHFAHGRAARRRRLGHGRRTTRRCARYVDSLDADDAGRAPAPYELPLRSRRATLDLRREQRMIRAAELIERKRNGEELSAEELTELVLGYARGEVPDYQMAAWCMAVYFRGLTGARDVRADRRDDRERRDARPRRARSAAASSTSTRPAASATRRRSRSARSSPPAASRSGR